MKDPQVWSAVFTFILVVVTIIYVVFTGKIVTASKGQRDAAAAQAKAAGEQSQAASEQILVAQAQLKATEAQLALSRLANAEQSRLAALESDRAGLLHVIEFMEESRQDRAFVRECVKLKRAPSTLSGEERLRIDKVCRSFDILGLFDRRGLVNPRLVDEFYAPPFVLLYESYLRPYVEEQREAGRRGGTHYWELVQFYERVKNVPKNHPGVASKSEWPADPRASPVVHV